MSQVKHSPKTRVVIDSKRGVPDGWRDIWHYRELLFFLTWRDITIRYKQTVIGIAWSAFRPLLTILVFTVIFSKVAHLPNQNIPYAILVCAAILPWQFFSNSLTDASNSLVNNSEILTKVYFPRLIFPISAIAISLVDFAISFGILALLMVWYRFIPSWTIITIPFFLLVAFTTSLGAGFFIASLNVRYRDFKFIVPFLLQLGLFVSPVGFSSSIVPTRWKLLYYMNPMAGVIDGFRWAVSGDSSTLYLPGLYISFTFAILFFIIGITFFRRMEKEFADFI